MLRNSREAIAVFPRPYFMLLLLFTVAKRLVREPCDHTSKNLQTARHSCMQKTCLPLSTLRRRDEPSAVRVRCREPCRLVSRTSPLGKRKLLTAKQMLHCGTVLVVTALHGAVESFKVLTLTSQPPSRSISLVLRDQVQFAVDSSRPISRRSTLTGMQRSARTQPILPPVDRRIEACACILCRNHAITLP